MTVFSQSPILYFLLSVFIMFSKQSMTSTCPDPGIDVTCCEFEPLNFQTKMFPMLSPLTTMFSFEARSHMEHEWPKDV